MVIFIQGKAVRCENVDELLRLLDLADSAAPEAFRFVVVKDGTVYTNDIDEVVRLSHRMAEAYRELKIGAAVVRSIDRLPIGTVEPEVIGS